MLQIIVSKYNGVLCIRNKNLLLCHFFHVIISHAKFDTYEAGGIACHANTT